MAGDPVNQLSLSVIAGGLESGKAYSFRYRARNVHGWSEYSPEELIVANTVPTKP